MWIRHFCFLPLVDLKYLVSWLAPKIIFYTPKSCIFRLVPLIFEAYYVCIFPLGILSGIVIIPGTAGGIFLGSYLVKRVDVRRSCKIAAKYCFIFQFIGTWAVLTFLIPGCKTTLLAGISQPYNNRYKNLFLSKFVFSLPAFIHPFWC